MSDSLDTIVSKIKKLLSLATSPNAHEAALAATKANELLVRHNLDMQSIASGVDSDLDDYKNSMIYQKPRLAFEAHWVMQIVQTHFFVTVVFKSARRLTKNDAYIYIVGKKTNVQVATFTFEFLIGKYKQLWAEYKKNTHSHNHLKGAYYKGLTEGLHNQLFERRRYVEISMALTVTKDPLLEKMVSQYHRQARYTSLPTPMQSDQSVHSCGYQTGRNLKIQTGITDANKKKELK